MQTFTYLTSPELPDWLLFLGTESMPPPAPPGAAGGGICEEGSGWSSKSLSQSSS